MPKVIPKVQLEYFAKAFAQVLPSWLEVEQRAEDWLIVPKQSALTKVLLRRYTRFARISDDHSIRIYHESWLQPIAEAAEAFEKQYPGKEVAIQEDYSNY